VVDDVNKRGCTQVSTNEGPHVVGDAASAVSARVPTTVLKRFLKSLYSIQNVPSSVSRH